MAAVTPHVAGAPVPVYSKSIQPLSNSSPTMVSDADTLVPFTAYTTLTAAECELQRLDTGTDVAFTIAAPPAAQNVLTIGVHVPPLVSVQIKGHVTGV